MALNTKTLFHLVPANAVAYEALLHPDNKRYVSQSSDENKRPGLEIGYHVPSIPQGHVITRLGRNTDLILRQTAPQHLISAVHVAFEINPATHLVILSVRSKRGSSVSITLRQSEKPKPQDSKSEDPESKQEGITGDSVLLYGQNYDISIGPYSFGLFWRIIAAPDMNAESLKSLAIQGFQTSLQQLQEVRSRDRGTGYDDSEYLSWHITRLNTANPRFEDIKELREVIGQGAFGKVYKAVDRISGHNFAIKVVDLRAYGDIESARALIHREIKVLERLKHRHIVEYLGQQNFQTLNPEILMPLCHGNLTSLAASPSLPIHHDHLCSMVLEQALCGLDYLASEKYIHRDIKPDNILYYNLGGGKYHFQLADFGLAHHYTLATTFCGTGYYQAPELWPQHSKIYAPQSPKMDIWSLFASLVHVHSKFRAFPPLGAVDYPTVLNALKDAAAQIPRLEAMARLHPDRRASAAQLLVLLFEGNGLTTKRGNIPEIGPHIGTALQSSPSPTAGASNPQQTRKGPGKGAQVPPAGGTPLIMYPPRRDRTKAGPGNPRVGDGGVIKYRAAAGVNALTTQPSRGKDAPNFKNRRGNGGVFDRWVTNRENALVEQLRLQEQPNLEEQSGAAFSIPGMFPN